MRLGLALRYVLNVVVLAFRQEGWRAAALTAVSLGAGEARKVPRLLAWMWRGYPTSPSGRPVLALEHKPVTTLPRLLAIFEHLDVDLRSISIDPRELEKHIERFSYPRFYAGGPVAKGGFREWKILEYFISLMLVPVLPSDVVIDIASERSVFPDMVRRLIGARVFRQDLAYRRGIHADRIGGSADEMPLPASFADKLMLHNSFEHFENDIDTKFVREAWRVLRPGGAVCIVPLYLSDTYQILTDPLLERDDITWDDDAEVTRVAGLRHRFGRLYSGEMLEKRVLAPARERGFVPTVYYVENIRSVEPSGGAHFALVLFKPDTRTTAPPLTAVEAGAMDSSE